MPLAPNIRQVVRYSKLVDYVTVGLEIQTTAHSAAAATAIITGNPVTYDGSTEVLIEFYAPGASVAGTGPYGIVNLWVDSTDLGRIAQFKGDPLTNTMPLYCSAYYTPAAGLHVFSVRAWSTASDSNLSLNGLVAGVPMFLRITRT